MTMPNQIDQCCDDYQNSPAAAEGAVVVQHRRHIGQRRIGHEQKAEERPENRIEGCVEPIGEKRDKDDPDAGEEESEDHGQALHV